MGQRERHQAWGGLTARTGAITDTIFIGGSRARKAQVARHYARKVRDTGLGYLEWARAEARARVDARRRESAAPERDLLLMAGAFPPASATGVDRPVSLARYGPELGWRVTVLSRAADEPASPSSRHLLGTLPPDVRLEHHGEPSIAPSRLLAQVDGGLQQAIAMFGAARRVISRSRPRVILATGPPFYAFVAAVLATRASRAKLVLDYRDEWTQSPFDFVERGWADRWWEGRCLGAADAVIFTTASQRDRLIRAFPGLVPSRCFVIPNGWEPGDAPASGAGAPVATSDDGRIVLSYVGRLDSWTPPAAFLSTLARVLERRPDLRRALSVRFVGPKPPASHRQLQAFPFPDVLDLVDQVPRPVASAIMRESTALLLLYDSLAMARYIPGKLYEYVAADRPVLVFGDTGEAASVVREIGAGPIVPAGEPAALEAVLDAFTRGGHAAPPSPDLDRWRARHVRAQLARETFTLLDRLSA
ncbi:MAG: glycosyltransferase [Candidatus Rokuibacteriota bacterium]